MSSSIVFSLLVSSLCYDAPQLICASIFESYNMYECNPNQPFRYFHLHHWWSHSTLRQWMSRPLLLRSPGHISKKKSFTSVKVKSTNPESFHSNKALTIDIKKPWVTNHNLGKNETQPGLYTFRVEKVKFQPECCFQFIFSEISHELIIFRRLRGKIPWK